MRPQNKFDFQTLIQQAAVKIEKQNTSGSQTNEPPENDKNASASVAADMRQKFFKGNLPSSRRLESALSAGDAQSADSEAVVEEP